MKYTDDNNWNSDWNSDCYSNMDNNDTNVNDTNDINSNGNGNARKVLLLVEDVIHAPLIGVVIGLLFKIVFFIIGLIIGTGDIIIAFEASRNAGFIVIGLLTFILAGMFLTNGKKKEEAVNLAFKRYFAILGYKSALLLIISGFIIVSFALDYLFLTID